MPCLIDAVVVYRTEEIIELYFIQKITRLFISNHPKKIEWQTATFFVYGETTVSTTLYPVYLRFRVYLNLFLRCFLICTTIMRTCRHSTYFAHFHIYLVYVQTKVSNSNESEIDNGQERIRCYLVLGVCVRN